MIFFQTIQPFFSTFQLTLTNFASNQDQTLPKKLTGILWTYCLTKQLVILQDQISNLTISDNPDPINIIHNTANIITKPIMNIHNHLPEKTRKLNTSI